MLAVIMKRNVIYNMIRNVVKKYNKLATPVKASLWFLLCSILQKAITTITTPIFTRILSTAEYGQFNTFNSWMGIITVFVTLNLNAGVFMQGIIKFENKRDEFTASMQGLMTTLTLAWLGVYFIFQNFWNNLFSLTTLQILCMFVIMWTSTIFGFWSVEKRVEVQYKSLVVMTIIYSLLRPILGVIFVIYSEDKVTARIVSIVIVNIAIYSALFIIKMYKSRCFYSGKFWKYAIAFNLPLIPHYLSTTILNSADRIMIYDMVGASQAGIYSLTYSLSGIMVIVNTALTQTVEPWIYQKIKQKDYINIEQLAYPLLVLVAIVNIMLIAFAPEIIAIFAPAEYYDAIWVIPPIAMSVFFMFAYFFFVVFEFYYEKKYFVMISTTIGAIINIILNYVFIGIYGYYAAGYTTLACYIIFAFCHYTCMKKICKEYLENTKVYNPLIIVSISIIFMSIGFIFLFTYKFIILRYLLIISIGLIMFIMRKQIQKIIIKILDVKKLK